MSPIFLNPAARNQMIAPALIAGLFAVLFLGISSLVVSLYPYSVSELTWRFSADAQALSTGPQISFLILMLVLVCVTTGSYRALRWAAILSLLFGVVLLAIVPFFALDFLTARHMQASQAVGPFTREGLRLGATGAVLGAILVWLGRRGLVATIKDPEQFRQAGHGLIVGQEEPNL